MRPSSLVLLLSLSVPGLASAQKKVAPPPKVVAAKPAAPAPGAIDAARVALVGADSAKAIAAAGDLAKTKSAAALDALLDGLATGLAPDVAQAAIDALREHRSAQAVDVLLVYAGHRHPGVRAKAVLALGSLDDKRADKAWRRAFSDQDKAVRAAAASIAAAKKDTASAPTLVTLMKKGDPVGVEVANLATPDIVRNAAELIGEVPDGILAQCLGAMLLRENLGKEDIYLELVRALAKIPGPEAVKALEAYVAATPEKPPRQSRREAQTMAEQKGGKK